MNLTPCNESVFKKIFDDHSSPLRNFIYYRSGNLELSQDLVQEAFVKLWQNCAKVPVDKAKSYLYKIAKNMLLNNVAHNKVRLKYESSISKENDNETPEFKMEEEEFKKSLLSAIEELPEDQRIVFLMSRIDKKKYREIAEELDLSVKAVEKRMHKALMALRKIYKKI